MKPKRIPVRCTDSMRILYYGGLVVLVLLSMVLWTATASAQPASYPAPQALPTRPSQPSKPAPQSPESSKPKSQEPAATPVPPVPTEPEEMAPLTFRTTLADLGYGDRMLSSPYDTAEYSLRLPESWELREGSFIELDLSYTYNRIGIPETPVLPSHFGDISVAIDGQTQRVLPIETATLAHQRLRVDLPVSLFNNSSRSTHSINVTLDAGYICKVPHTARLVIHSVSSRVSLTYDQLPITADLAFYPHPFYQRAFEQDQVRFVLPAQPAETDLVAAVDVAAKLGDLAHSMVISGTTDLELMERILAGRSLREHMIVVGRPETNEVILRLNQLGALPVPLRERRLGLSSKAPAVVGFGDVLTYTLALTNTAERPFVSLTLIDALPAYADLVACSPACTPELGGREVHWSIPSVEVGEALSYTLALRLSDRITNSVAENVVTLLDPLSGPLNVNTLTTTVRSTLSSGSGSRVSVSADNGYFFSHQDRGVSENDGVVQELASPWDQTRAILVLTGLSDAAVYKASQAMGQESHFPGMKGQFAFVRTVRPLPEQPSRPQAADLTFADLGYENKVLEGYAQEINYYFYLPVGWRLAKGAYLDLQFSHSRLLDYGSSFLNVLFNSQPVATIALSDATSQSSELRVELPPSQARSGKLNKISIQTRLRLFDECAHIDRWLVINNASLLHLDHEALDVGYFALDFYPYPFDQRSDLTDVLFALPLQPQPGEWEVALRLAAELGNATGGPSLAPAVALGKTSSEAELVASHVIAIGRPSRNPTIRQVNEQLPQPFHPDSDEIEQQVDEVVFRLPPTLSLGLVQLIPSPWNETRAFLAVTGTTDESVKWAGEALTDRRIDLEGNLVLIREGEVNAMDTRGLTRSGVVMAVATAVPEMAPVTPATTMITSTSVMSTSEMPTVLTAEQAPVLSQRIPMWLILLVGVTGLAVAAILGVAFWQSRRQTAG